MGEWIGWMLLAVWFAVGVYALRERRSVGYLSAVPADLPP